MRKHTVTLGLLLATPGALELLSEKGERIETYLARHAAGDWGDVEAEDWYANDMALILGDRRLFSSYQIDDQKIWIITDYDRSTTTVLRPQDY